MSSIYDHMYGYNINSKGCPAAVHIDGTARPQIDEKATKFMNIDNARRSNGVGWSSISFNLHEEPIVCTPDESIRAERKQRMPFGLRAATFPIVSSVLVHTLAMFV